MATTTLRQQQVLNFINHQNGQWVSPTDIGRNVWGRGHHSSSASPVCKKLVNLGFLERNKKGKYRIRKEEKDASIAEQLYRIKPLVWEGCDQIEPYGDGGWRSNPTIGSLSVYFRDNGIVWSVCFDEYYDETEGKCDSFKHGKKLAEAHWRERIAQCLEAVETGATNE